MSHAFPCNLIDTLNRRIHDMFEPLHFSIDGPALEVAGSLMRKFRKHDAMRIIKTWFNSWATTYRYHEPDLFPCLFGCRHGIDDQKHYVSCPILLEILCMLRPDTPQDMFERIGLANFSSENLLGVACTFSGYHALRRSSSLMVLSALPRQTLLHRTRSMRTFAEAFYAEALQVNLKCRRPYPLLYSLDLSNVGGRAVPLSDCMVPDFARLGDLRGDPHADNPTTEPEDEVLCSHTSLASSDVEGVTDDTLLRDRRVNLDVVPPLAAPPPPPPPRPLTSHPTLDLILDPILKS